MFDLVKIVLFPVLLFPFKLLCQQRLAMDEAGVVISFAANVPVEGATVIIHPGSKVAVTDEFGKFFFKNALTSDSIFISAIGFEPKAISYEEFEGNHNIISLNQRHVELSSITILANRKDQLNHISKIDIQMRNLTNSQEILRLVPGLFIGQHAGGGKAEQLFLRGFDLDHGTDINISVDGIPINMVSHAHGQGYADLHFLIPESIEDVNFRKGPYYAEKGNLTTAGYVEYKTKNSLPTNLIKIEAGQFSSYRTVAMINLLNKQSKQNQSAFISSEYMYTNGYFQNPQHFNRINLFGKYYKKINEKNDVVFSASTFYSRWNASGQIPERAVKSGVTGFFGSIDPNEGGKTRRTNLNLQLQTILKHGDSFKNQLYYTKYNFQLYSDFTFFLIDSLNGDQIRQKESRDLFGYNGIFLHKNNGKFSTEAGVSLRYDKTKNSELSRSKNKNVVTDSIQFGDIRELNVGIWINETIDINKKWTLSSGLRYDHFNNTYFDKLEHISKMATAGMVSPKINFYYQPGNKTKLYLTAGKGFHSNDTRIAVETDGRKILTAAYGSDIGVILKPTKNILLQSALWYLKLDQEFVYVGDEGVVKPSGSSKRLGLDFSLRYQLVKWLYVDFDGNYSHGRSAGKGRGQNYLPLAPVFTSIGGITYRNDRGWNASLRYRYMGSRPADESNIIRATGYFVTDALVNFTQQKFEAGISIQNLFYVQWKETQFETTSRLRGEALPVTEIHFTPGTPFFFKTHISIFF
ncbi:MAG: TonB-dependent receptor [Bacteroidetes bacterium]|nr:MAG: TonB-dependent receptor [Bacteroidota bacterium]